MQINARSVAVGLAARQADKAFAKFARSQPVTRSEARFAMTIALIADCATDQEREDLRKTIENLFPAQIQALSLIAEAESKH